MAATAGASLSPYVLLEIFEHLSPRRKHLPEGLYIAGPLAEDERHIRRQCLARLALVSRFVSALALDVLWAHVDDFRDLLSVFPSYDRQFTRFRDIVTDADWTRFKAYAARVRSLHLGDFSDIHANVWTILTRLSPRESLLPNLERLTGFVVDELSACYATLFSPTIRELELRVDKNVDAGTVRMVLQAARSTLSALQHLTIDDDINVAHNGDPDRPHAVQFWTLMQLESLHVVQDVSLTIDQLQSLARLPDLQTLSLGLKDMPDLRTPLPVGSFAQLRDLTLAGPLQHIGAFLATASPPLLQSFTANTDLKCFELASIRRAKEAIISMPALLPTTTRRLHLAMTCKCTSNDEMHFPNAGELLEPLRTLVGLRDVQLVFTMKFHLPDKVLHSLRDAWPQLRVFVVGTLKKPMPSPQQPVWNRYGHAYRPQAYEYIQAPILAPVLSQPQYGYSRSPSPEQPVRTDDPPTIATIAAFAFSHPHLESLEVPALDLTLPEPDAVPILGHHLREFRISELPAASPLFDCALVLDVLFPHLDLDDGRDAVLDGGHDQMAELSLILLGLQAGRVGAHWSRAAKLGGYKGDIPLLARRRAPPSRESPQRQAPIQQPNSSRVVVHIVPTPPSPETPSEDSDYYGRAAPFGT
ncbi:hypothetical protein FKP32DRAFT_1569235 [Trametes sanguinea]|nr:hypothetical protein FKP32DRAFT_1569235 [Trametes sanguinea]